MNKFFCLAFLGVVAADHLPTGTYCGHDVPLKLGFKLSNVRALVRDGTLEVDFDGVTSMHCRGDSMRQKYKLDGKKLTLQSDSKNNCINQWLPKHHIHIDSLKYNPSCKSFHLKISKKVSWFYTARRELDFEWKSDSLYSKCSAGHIVG